MDMTNPLTMEAPLAPSSISPAPLILTSLMYTVGQLASFTSDPGVAHWNVIKHLFQH